MRSLAIKSAIVKCMYVYRERYFFICVYIDKCTYTCGLFSFIYAILFYIFYIFFNLLHFLLRFFIYLFFLFIFGYFPSPPVELLWGYPTLQQRCIPAMSKVVPYVIYLVYVNNLSYHADVCVLSRGFTSPELTNIQLNGLFFFQERSVGILSSIKDLTVSNVLTKSDFFCQPIERSTVICIQQCKSLLKDCYWGGRKSCTFYEWSLSLLVLSGDVNLYHRQFAQKTSSFGISWQFHTINLESSGGI